MKKMIRYSFIAAIAAVSFSSCKKDDDKTRLELLTEKNWKIISDKEQVDSGPWVEYISQYDACELDDYTKFNANNLVEENQGATKCDPSSQQSYTAPWSFANGETQINWYGYMDNIEELTESRLVLTSSDTSGTTIYHYKITYSH